MHVLEFLSLLVFQVPPVDYFKHVILELQNETGTPQQQQQQQQQPQQQQSSPSKSTIRALQKRFEEVSSFCIYSLYYYIIILLFFYRHIYSIVHICLHISHWNMWLIPTHTNTHKQNSRWIYEYDNNISFVFAFCFYSRYQNYYLIWYGRKLYEDPLTHKWDQHDM